MRIPVSVISNTGGPPEVVDGHSTDNNIRVIHFVVVAHPGSSESPEGLHGGVGSESSHLLGLPS